MDLFNQINTHKYLYLDKLIEEKDLELVLWISEAGVVENNDKALGDASSYGAIETSDLSKRYKMTFDNYVAFSIRNESYTEWDDDEIFSGNLFRKYSKSKFLDYVSASVNTWLVEQLRERAHSHIGIVCLNHVIDIAVCEEPIIEEIES